MTNEQILRDVALVRLSELPIVQNYWHLSDSKSEKFRPGTSKEGLPKMSFENTIPGKRSKSNEFEKKKSPYIPQHKARGFTDS